MIMTRLFQKDRTIKEILGYHAFIAVIAGVVLTCIGTILLAGSLYFVNLKYIQSSLKDAFPKVREGIYSYLAAGYNADDLVVREVVHSHTVQFDLSAVRLCKKTIQDCLVEGPTESLWYGKELGVGNTVLLIGKPKPKIPFIPAFALLGIFLLGLGTSTWVQNSLLRKFILGPAMELLRAIENDSNIPVSEQWPREFQDVYQNRQRLLAEKVHSDQLAELSDFAHYLLHDMKRPIRKVFESLKQNRIPSASEVKEMLSILDKTHDWILKGLEEYKQRRASDFVRRETGSLLGSAMSDIWEVYSGRINNGMMILFDVPTLYQYTPIRRQLLYRMIQNLIENALDATKAVEDREIVVNVVPSYRYCDVVVLDNGVPFPAEVKTGLTGDSIPSNKSGGSGIGLANTKLEIEKFGGSLFIDDHDEKRIVLRVPVVAYPKWLLEPYSVRSEVFVLDDDPTIKEQVENTLHSTVKSKVTLYSDETEFLTAAAANQDAFLLVDHEFGGKRVGLDLIQQEGLGERSALLSGKIPFDMRIVEQLKTKSIKGFPKEYLFRAGA